MLRKLLLSALVFLLCAALMGCLLRLYSTGLSTGLIYGNVLHAHSHTAMMGWVYIALASLVYHHFLGRSGYHFLFGATVCAVVGLLIAFIVQGYGPVSIFFCVLHLACSYIFAFKVLRTVRGSESQADVLLKIAMYMLLASTLGLWGIGPSMALSDRVAGLFSACIQFYLHFQFNGFFYFGVLALIFSSSKVVLKQTAFNSFVAFSVLSTVLTFALPLSWFFSGAYHYLWLLLGMAFQVIALCYFLPVIKFIANGTFFMKCLSFFALSSLVLKHVLPLFFVNPDIMRLSHEIRSITIGYIHLLMLGMITAFLIFWMAKIHVLDSGSKSFKWGVFLFLVSFCLTEGLLLLQSAQVLLHFPSWKYQFSALACCSLPFPVAVVCWIFSVKKEVIG